MTITRLRADNDSQVTALNGKNYARNARWKWRRIALTRFSTDGLAAQDAALREAIGGAKWCE